MASADRVAGAADWEEVIDLVASGDAPLDRAFGGIDIVRTQALRWCVSRLRVAFNASWRTLQLQLSVMASRHQLSRQCRDPDGCKGDGGLLLWGREITARSFESCLAVVEAPVVRANVSCDRSLRLAANSTKGQVTELDRALDQEVADVGKGSFRAG